MKSAAGTHSVQLDSVNWVFVVVDESGNMLELSFVALWWNVPYPRNIH